MGALRIYPWLGNDDGSAQNLGCAVFRLECFPSVQYILVMPPITGYITKAMAKARFKRLGTGEIYADIPQCRGVWATGANREACRKELQEVLEDWLLLKLRDGDPIPAVGDFELTLAV